MRFYQIYLLIFVDLNDGGDDEVFKNTDEGRGEPSKKAQNPVDVGDVDKGYISMLTF